MSGTVARADDAMRHESEGSSFAAAVAGLGGVPSVEAPSVEAEPRHGRVRATAQTLLALAAALLATEALLRVVIPPEEAFGTWFSRGVHTPDEKYGLVFTPKFRGVMSHPDGVPCVPLELDRHGHRLPAGPEGAAEVVAVGGGSMMFSYGLADGDAIHTHVARRTTVPVRVRNTAWPGFDLVRNLHACRDVLGPDHGARVAVVAFYRLGPGPRPPEAPDQLPPPPPREELFAFFDDLAPGPRDPLTRRLGSLYYATYLGARGVEFARSVFLRCRGIGRYARGMLVPSVGPLTHEGALGVGDFARQRAIFSHVIDHFAANGTKVLVVLLPAASRGPEHYAAVGPLIPEGIPWLDLHREFGSGFLEGHTIAAGHYDAYAAARIGERIADAVSRLLAGAPE